MAYLTILSILFVHENLEDRLIIRKVLNRRGGWVLSAVIGQCPKKRFFGPFPLLRAGWSKL